MQMLEQIFWTLILSIVAASIAWTVTQEEIFAEIREQCEKGSKSCKTLIERKFFYVFTCEYCFSHYVAAVFVVITDYKLLFDDWRGYLIGGFALVWVANQYMSLYNRLRLDIKSERLESEIKEKVIEIKEKEAELEPGARAGVR